MAHWHSEHRFSIGASMPISMIHYQQYSIDAHILGSKWPAVWRLQIDICLQAAELQAFYHDEVVVSADDGIGVCFAESPTILKLPWCMSLGLGPTCLFAIRYQRKGTCTIPSDVRGTACTQLPN